jgi:glycolate oxidase iron-sulfur subunit
MHLLTTELAGHPSTVFEDVFSRCLLCGACEQVCPRQLPIRENVSRARSHFSRFYGPNGLQKAVACTALSSPALLEGLVRAGISLRRIRRLPMHSGLRLKLGLPEERTKATAQPPASQFIQSFNLSQEQDSSEISYFSGCFARHLQPSIAHATRALLNRCGLSAVHTVHTPAAQHCCGLAAWSAGRQEQARALARKNIQAFSGTDGPIITSCASCSSHLLSYPNLFTETDPWYKRACAFADRVREFTAFFNNNLPSVPLAAEHRPERIFYHDPVIFASLNRA